LNGVKRISYYSQLPPIAANKFVSILERNTQAKNEQRAKGLMRPFRNSALFFTQFILEKQSLGIQIAISIN
jgi:hypothetical protein